jgi:hypothetical protein
MAQKKAFVRYAQNKAVPGSLIVRTKAPKVGTWKEVPYDICCGGGGNCCSNETIITLSFTPPVSTYTSIQLVFKCDGQTITSNIIYEGELNLSQVVDKLNGILGNPEVILPLLGTFSLDGDTILLELTECQYKRLCPDGELTFELALPV